MIFKGDCNRNLVGEHFNERIPERIWQSALKDFSVRLSNQLTLQGLNASYYVSGTRHQPGLQDGSYSRANDDDLIRAEPNAYFWINWDDGTGPRAPEWTPGPFGAGF